MGCDKTENFKRFSVEYYEMGSGLHRSKITLTTEMLSTMTTEEMNAKCDERGGGLWYYLDIRIDCHHQLDRVQFNWTHMKRGPWPS